MSALAHVHQCSSESESIKRGSPAPTARRTHPNAGRDLQCCRSSDTMSISTICLTKVRTGSPKSFSSKAYYALMVLGAFLVVSTTASVTDAATVPPGTKLTAEPPAVGSWPKTNNAINRFQTAGLLTGVTLTTGGAMWAAERLTEALKNTEHNLADQISVEYTAAFSSMLFVGLFFLSFYILRNIGFDTWSQIVFAGIAGSSGALIGLGFHCLSSQMTEGGNLLFNVDSILCFGFSAFLLLALVALVFYEIRNKEMENMEERKELMQKAVVHGVGFLALFGGSTQFAFTFGENMQDRTPFGEDTPLGAFDPDNMGLEALSVWFLWTIGFAWLIKTFLINSDHADKIPATIFALCVGATTAGLLVGGFELVVSNAAVSPEGIFLLTCGGALIVAFITLKVFVRKGCLQNKWLKENL